MALIDAVNKIYRCDYCKSNFSVDTRRMNNKNELHFCSKNHANAARKKGGVIYEKVRQTHLQKYNVEFMTQHPKLKNAARSVDANKKRNNTCINRYGSMNPMGSSAIRKKCYSSSKTKISKDETKFVNFLRKNIDKDIKQQVLVNNSWLIDAYLPMYNTYIQFDGVHWHGLTKPLSEIKLLAESSSHWAAILAKYQRDLIQNDWFKKKKMQLLRIPFSSFEETSLAVFNLIVNQKKR